MADVKSEIIIKVKPSGKAKDKVDLIDPRELQRGLKPVLSKTARKIRRKAVENVNAGAPVGQAHPSQLSVRSGTLRKSIGMVLDPANYSFIVGAGGLGPSRNYAAVHELGRKAMSKPPGQYFLIPLPAYLTKAGAAAQPKSGLKIWRLIDTYLKPIKKGGGSGYAWGPQYKMDPQRLRYKALRAGGGIGYGPLNKRGAGPKPEGYIAFEKTTNEPFYLLLKTIGRLKARPYLTPAWKDSQVRFEEEVTGIIAQLMDPE